MPRRRHRGLLHTVERAVAIAAAVHVPADAVVALIEVGEGKLAALLDLSDEESGPQT